MDFDQFTKRLPNLKRARTQEDSDRILSFLEKNTSAQKRFTLFYDRSPDFFNLLRLSSPDHYAITYENTENEIEGVITLTILKANGFETLYVGDLRIKAKSDEIKTKWRAFTNDFIANVRDIEEFKNIKFIHMVMMDDNTKAYQRLVASKILGFDFKKVQSYQMVNILGKKWWKTSGAKAFSHTLIEATKESMLSLLSETSQNKFGSNHPDLLTYRAERMAPFATILEVFDTQGVLLFRSSLENPALAKRILIKKLPLSLNFLSQFLPLFKGKKYTQGRSLDILYLSNVCFHSSVQSKPKAMGEILSYAIETALNFSQQRFHMVSLSLFQTEADLLKALKPMFLIQTEPLGYYQIILEGAQDIPRDQLPNLNMSYI